MANLIHLLQDFNPGKFLVYLSLLIFVALLSLRFDGVTKINYWAVFSPLWIMHGMVLIGAGVGSIAWWKYPASRIDPESYIHFKSMLVSSSLHLLLIFFEVLACDKLQSSRHIWVLVFLPVLFLSIICIAVSIWALKHERPFEVELFLAVNLLQLIFIPLKLDGVITWKWELVFIPIWIIYGAAIIGVSYSILLVALFSRSVNITSDQRRASTHAASGYVLLVIPSLISVILLTKKLNGDLQLSYSVVNIPLLIALTSLVLRSFTGKGGNLWWCGMQKDFCVFLLDFFPFLREYGNVSYHRQSSEQRSFESNDTPEVTVMSPNRYSPNFFRPKVKNINIDSRTVVPVLIIDLPD
ncbi:Transmembrane protein 185A [Daphnia magna]|uniref:Transmembrane protein 185A n=1 Tax=Daphnia magna TaxID=35525 RepID=A0A0N8CH43_9CRUS|nr:Transmembrane protein 185A [Daphnia magna]CAG4639285.1 EOG090X087A [Daphnia magna]